MLKLNLKRGVIQSPSSKSFKRDKGVITTFLLYRKKINQFLADEMLDSREQQKEFNCKNSRNRVDIQI